MRIGARVRSLNRNLLNDNNINFRRCLWVIRKDNCNIGTVYVLSCTFRFYPLEQFRCVFLTQNDIKSHKLIIKDPNIVSIDIEV